MAKGLQMICEDCKEIATPKFRIIKRPSGIHEHVVACSECEGKTTSHYTNGKIRKLQAEQRKARESKESEKASEIFEEVGVLMKELSERFSKEK